MGEPESNEAASSGQQSECRRAFVTGITGQDGSYLTELLLAKGYEVHGLVRRSSSITRSRLDHLFRDAAVYRKRLFLHYSDLDDVTTIRRILVQVRPDEMYHLAGQSHVGLSFDIPESTSEFTAMGTLRILEILRDLDPIPRFLHTSSSEVFGSPVESPQSEDTPFRPVTPYGVAKAFATNMVRVYRESHGFFACNAICFNHESPRRGESFVPRKITRAAARISLGLEDKLKLGNLDARRDWGFAKEYVEAMWRMLQQDEADDFVISTGTTHAVRDLLDVAFRHVELDWEQFVEIDPRFLRPNEGLQLVGDSTAIRRKTGWEPESTFEKLITSMVETDLTIARHENINAV